MEVCLGGIQRKIEMNLIDRAHFTKPILIGRSGLSGFVIDPSETGLTCKMRCQPAIKQPDCDQ